MKASDRRAAWGARMVVVGLLVFAGLRWGAPAGAASGARRWQADPQIGPVGVLALDNQGNGWAWAAPKPQTFATSFLLRIENGAWHIVADSTSNPGLLPPGLGMQRLAITADGRAGWAIGNIAVGA